MSPEFNPALLGLQVAAAPALTAGLNAVNSSLFNVSKPKASAVYGAVSSITGLVAGTAINLAAEAAFPEKPLAVAGTVYAAALPNMYFSHKVGQKVAEKYCDVTVTGKDALKLWAIGVGEALALTLPVTVTVVAAAIFAAAQEQQA